MHGLLVCGKGEHDPKGTWLKNMLLDNVLHKSRIVRDYYFEGPLEDIAERLIGPNLKGVTAQLTLKFRGNTKRVHWHQDNVYGELEPYNAITCLTALDDSDETNGCLWIAPGSHKKGRGAPTSQKKKKMC
ncbi:MAG: phytanoyl-CoA dioxygenase family protein [Paracoccaceae bacterium]|nr:phytanoyl-CoA dioxygenase family protein [Paracoccaceae bacterium]